MQLISNHPAHIMIDGQEEISPSAFIPFCSVGGDKSVMGKHHDKFNIPICNKFRPTILEGQRCYKVDVNEHRFKVDKKKMVHEGIDFLLDYNFDRMMKVEESRNTTVQELSQIKKDDQLKNEARIYIETLGKNEPVFGEGKYTLTEVTEMDGTEAFLGLDEGTKNCQARETFQECQAKEYIRNGLAKCNCTPFEMRDHFKAVSGINCQAQPKPQLAGLSLISS
jgi:hypothetical protein